jgi:hypothetical protein
MVDIDRGFELARQANPHPTREVEGKPSADEMLLAVRSAPAPAQLAQPRRQWRRGPVLAAAVFALVLAVLLPVLLLGDEPPPVTEPPTTTTTEATSTTTSLPPLPTTLDDAVEGAWSNLWGVWEFDDEGSFQVSTGGVLRDLGTYAVDANLLTLTSTERSRDCPAAVGTYTVEVGAAGLEFTAVEPDGCDARSSALDGSTLGSAPPPAEPPLDPVPDAATQALIDRFAAIYDSGDIDALEAFFHPDFERMVIRELAEEPQPVDTVLTLFEVDAALNMELSLECEARPGSVICTPTKFDDLLRVLGRSPSEDRAWEFTFEDGLLREWVEQRPNAACCYEVEAIQPFLQWVRENRPEVGTLFPFEDGDWIIREGIAAEVAALVDEWAADQGVTLDP